MRYAFLMLVLVVAAFTGCKESALAQYSKFSSDADVPRITVEDAKKAVDAGTAVIIDVRAEAAYNLEHIAGSSNVPIGSKDDKIDALPKDKKLILYCSCSAEHTSAAMGFQLNQKGIPNVYALVGGSQGWASAGYPMEKGQ